jgi:hypothetical protein
MTTSTTTLQLFEALQVYFQGEKTEALVFILPVGLLSLVFSAWLFTDGGGGFARGVAIPFLAMGLLMSTVGAVVGLRTPSQQVQLRQSLQRDPVATQVTEVARMAAVDKAWNYYLAMWGIFGVVGLVLRFATRGDLTQGLGIALVFFAGVGLLIDGFAERRTHPYMAALSAAQADRTK